MMDMCISLACLIFMMSATAVESELLPDLVPDPVITFKSMFVFKRKLKDMSCALEEGCASSSAFKVVENSDEWFEHERTLMIFGTASWNFGSKAFTFPSDPKEWLWHKCHKHYHSMENFAYYDILDAQGNKAAEGHKASYCLRDTACMFEYKSYYDCKGRSHQGISPGCKDVYDRLTDCQWIDMTDVAPGDYILQTHINPERTVPELNFENNVINCDITFDGTSVTPRSCKLGGVQVGDSCKSTSDCRYPDSHCENSTCGCREGYRSYDVKGFHTGCIPDCDPDEKFTCENGGTPVCPICLECQSTAPWRCECPTGFSGEKCEEGSDLGSTVTKSLLPNSPDPGLDLECKLRKKWKKRVKANGMKCLGDDKKGCTCKDIEKFDLALLELVCRDNIKGGRKACCKLCKKHGFPIE